ncbi:MAG: transglutaminase family protein, partial [Cyanobacteria bacterium]|nr:transglutaminase family protein [Cyanobacteriota bacterium]
VPPQVVAQVFSTESRALYPESQVEQTPTQQVIKTDLIEGKVRSPGADSRLEPADGKPTNGESATEQFTAGGIMSSSSGAPESPVTPADLAVISGEIASENIETPPAPAPLNHESTQPPEARTASGDYSQLELFRTRTGEIIIPFDRISETRECSSQAMVTAELTTFTEKVCPLPQSGSETIVVGVVPVTMRSARPRVLSVLHETVYEYKNPVEYSTHRLHVHPVHDRKQELLACSIEVTPKAEMREFEDVFGNHCVDLLIDKPYTRLDIAVHSRVKVYPQPHLQSPNERMTVPLVWMPWQRQMMLPYLLPSELPESELRTLTDFAMGFVKREDYDLLEALLEMNKAIFTDFEYVTGSTKLTTTPFEVLVKRQGVCQDFANLLICMARLLGIPARYRVGYINTGADYENKVQSEASHAWAELYLPLFGWYGFDPTNGCLVGTDHIRVAAGRNYRDASPTSGTIYKGGGVEKLSVAVRVKVES